MNLCKFYQQPSLKTSIQVLLVQHLLCDEKPGEPFCLSEAFWTMGNMFPKHSATVQWTRSVVDDISVVEDQTNPAQV